MKALNTKNISALIALLLAVTVLTSANTSVSENSSVPVTSFELDLLDEVDGFMDEYFEELELADLEQFETEESDFLGTEKVKVYDANNNLLVNGERASLNEVELKVLNQADLLTEENDIAYYQLNN